MKNAIKRGINQLGYQVARRTVESSREMRLSRLLELRKIDVVLDVGANVGQFATTLLDLGYRGKIFSFEPLSDAHTALTEAARRVPSWKVMRRMALGTQDGEIEINIAGNSVSSSLLPMRDSHVSAAPQSVYVGKERVPIARLDSVLSDEMLAGNVLLKIDSQGYESQILEGAEKTLSKVDSLLLEMSLVELYGGQMLMRELWGKLEEQGFALWSIEPSLHNPNTGQLLQTDTTFVRVQR